MTRTINISRQRGFSMVEALFSALILGIALLALAGFQAVALQDGSLIKARSVAANLAQEKLDDLRSFTYLTDGDSSDDGSTASASNLCGLGNFCFSEIAGNAGGQEESDGDLILPAGSVAGYIDNYTLSWDVACYAESAAAQLGIVNCADPDGNPATDDIPSAKLVTVTLSWTDSKGTAQSVFLQGIIYAMDPSRVARAAISPVSTQGPRVSYTPIGVPDAVPVPISTGDGKFKESSKPLPDVSSKGYSLRTEFDAVSYTTAGGTTKKDSQIEFATVNCVCEFAGSGQGYPASYFYWTGGNLDIKVPEATVTKMTGTAPSISGDKQDPLCTACCRDHHDSEAPGTANPSTALYDPDRPAADYAGNNHKHYYYANAANPANGLIEVLESTGAKYLEACRFARVDGVYRLLQDWRALDMVVMPKLDYLENESKLAAYQTYLLDYLRYQSKVDCTASGATGCSDIEQSAVPVKSDLPSRNLTNQNTNAKPQLLARALYSDRVYSEGAPRTLDAAYYTYLANKIAAGTWLDILPFNEVNVTLLASWHSDDATSVSVRNDKILSISATASDYYGVYYRGEALVNSGGDGIANIWAHLLPGNSGLTGGATRATYLNMVDYDASTLLPTANPVGYDATTAPNGYASELGTDRHDHASSLRKSNSIQVSRSGASPPQASGSVRVGNSSADLSSVTVAQTPGSTACTVSYTAGDNSGSFGCSVSYTGNVQISGSGFFFNNAPDADGNGSFDAGIDGGAYTDINSCPSGNCGNFWVFGPTAYVSGKCHGNQCANSTFASTIDESTYVACTLDLDGVTVKCPVTLDEVSHTWSGKIRITGNGSIYVKADATSCDATAGTGAKLTAASILAGPADKQAAFNMCASDLPSQPAAPSAPTILGVNTSGSTTTVSWSNVSGETGYKVYKCTQSGNASCAPTDEIGGTLADLTSLGVTRPGNGETFCFNVKAYVTAGGVSSYGAASQTMCVYRSGGSYTYTGPF